MTTNKRTRPPWARRVLLTLSGLLASHKAGAATLAGGGVAALVISPMTEAAFSVIAGFAGALVVHAMREPTSVMRALGSAVASVFIGAFGGPAAVGLAGHYLSVPQHWTITVLASFLLAATWPITAPWVMVRARALVTGRAEPSKGAD